LVKLHWESWLLRGVLLGTLAFQIVTGNKDGAMVAGEGVVVSLLPIPVQRLSGTHVPRALELAFVLGMALQFCSESTKLFEVFYYWDKIVHPTLVALSAMIAVWLLLGYRDAFRTRLPTHLAAAFAMLLGLSIGAFWEFVEFASDWFGDANLQKSNADTVTDILANNTGAFVATLLGLWIYLHLLGPNQRDEMGRIARWLGHGPRRLLDSHGRLLGAAAAAAFAAVLFASQWVDRGIPALASGLATGSSRDWSLVNLNLGDPTADAQPLAGDWVPDPRGICRENLEHPKPGSEKMGLLQLGPGTVYGLDGQPFSVQAQYVEERPPKVDGSEMDAGIAFGIRDAENFYLLEESALHDILRLDRYIHGKRRDVREALLRTHGNEWHTLLLSVDGGTVTAGLDGAPAYTVTGLEDTAGGIGVWGRTAAATCFSDARAEVGSPGSTQALTPLPEL
jgi:hypothetical protein